MTAVFEILSVDLEKKRIGVALVEEGSARAAGATQPHSELVPGARVTDKVERHEKFGVFVFLAAGRTGLIPLSETGIGNEANVAKAFPVGTTSRSSSSRSTRRVGAFVSAAKRSWTPVTETDHRDWMARPRSRFCQGRNAALFVMRVLSRAALASPASFLRCSDSRRGASIASNLIASRIALRARVLNGFEIRIS